MIRSIRFLRQSYTALAQGIKIGFTRLFLGSVEAGRTAFSAPKSPTWIVNYSVNKQFLEFRAFEMALFFAKVAIHRKTLNQTINLDETSKKNKKNKKKKTIKHYICIENN